MLSRMPIAEITCALRSTPLAYDCATIEALLASVSTGIVLLSVL